ncbi:MAG: hypothetical protein NUV78_00050 [Candidatus Zambryskibacteria bacterium]|nr:hypothetical protein [Candidatus Zambryskibacteria bacterium]
MSIRTFYLLVYSLYMNIFRNYTLSWKLIALLKFALLFIGIAIGSYWPEYFLPYAPYLLVIGMVAGLYVKIVALKS